MPTNSMLSIRPNYELVTRYASTWQTQILNAARSAGLPYVDLYEDAAVPTNFFSYLESNDPLVVNILGHGGYNLIVAQNNELLLTSANTGVLANRVVFDLSCKAGRDLGSAAIDNGCISFLGYNEDFWVCFSKGEHPDGGMLNPLDDRTSRGFLEPHNIAPITFVQGGTTTNSYWASQNSFTRWIRVWKLIDSGIAAHLMWNRDHQIMKPSAGPRPTIFPALLMFAPLLIIPFWKKFK